MSKRSHLHLLFAVLLLFGQYGALTHWAWHLANHAPAKGSPSVPVSDSQGSAPSGGTLQATLCDLHMAMGSLLAGDCATAKALPAAELRHGFAQPVASVHFAQAALTPPARAPPALL